MEFLNSKHSYNTADFYELFHKRLPVVVKVIQGFCGEIAEDTFDRDQIFAINAVSRQRRVVGKVQIRGEEKLISIPENFMEKMCIVQESWVGPEEDLHVILSEYTLPMRVQLPSGKVLSVGNRTINTSTVPPIQLIKCFEEVSLVCHSIIEGQIDYAIHRIPLYLPVLLSPIIKTGLKNSTAQKWNTFLDSVKAMYLGRSYDQHWGNPNIAEYDPNAIHNEERLTYTQPRSYSNFVELIHGHPLKDRPRLSSLTDNSEDSDFSRKPERNYRRPLPPLPKEEPIEKLTTSNQNQKLKTSIRPSSTDDSYLTPIHPVNLASKAKLNNPQNRKNANSKSSAVRSEDSGTSVHRSRTRGNPPIYEKSPQSSVIHSDDSYLTPMPPIRKLPKEKTVQNQSNKTLVPPKVSKSDGRKTPDPDYDYDEPPELPEKRTQKKALIRDYQSPPPKYTNNIPRTQVYPILQLSQTPVLESQTQDTQMQKGYDTKTDPDLEVYQRVKNVKTLTVKELCGYLDILNLGKYSEEFKENMVDGTVLSGLNETILREDFGMNGIESFRLLKFAKEGYLPS